ncbi:MAG: hypothetical protein JWQ95_5098 [Sphaerisporangium sp.]|nr:hypothetical protein [Sphaerisporangium sp.]
MWAVGTVTTYLCCDNRIYHREVVMHWDGHTWSLIDLGIRGLDVRQAVLDVRQAVPDGHGGLWIAACCDDGSGALITIHYRDGRWSKSTLPLPDSYQSVEAGQITLTDRGKILVTTTAYTAPDGIPVTVEYTLTS